MKKHMEEKEFKCKACKKAFLHKQALETHIAARHPRDAADRPAFSCPFEGCEFIAASKGNVRTHCMRIHFVEEITPLLERDTDTGAIVCTACTDSFSSLPAFYYHAIKCIEVPHTDARAAALDILL